MGTIPQDVGIKELPQFFPAHTANRTHDAAVMPASRLCCSCWRG
jgi:hypothetical protein